MLVRIERSELWPLYELEEYPHGFTIEVDERDEEYIRDTMKHFWKVQGLLESAYMEAIEKEG